MHAKEKTVLSQIQKIFLCSAGWVTQEAGGYLRGKVNGVFFLIDGSQSHFPEFQFCPASYTTQADEKRTVGMPNQAMQGKGAGKHETR